MSIGLRSSHCRTFFTLCDRRVVKPGIFPEGTRFIGAFPSSSPLSKFSEVVEKTPLIGRDERKFCSCSKLAEEAQFRDRGNVVDEV